jgi:hypothetical protein
VSTPASARISAASTSGISTTLSEQVVGLLTEQGALRRRGQVLDLADPGELPVPETLSALITPARHPATPR